MAPSFYFPFYLPALHYCLYLGLFTFLKCLLFNCFSVFPSLIKSNLLSKDLSFSDSAHFFPSLIFSVSIFSYLPFSPSVPSLLPDLPIMFTPSPHYYLSIPHTIIHHPPPALSDLIHLYIGLSSLQKDTHGCHYFWSNGSRQVRHLKMVISLLMPYSSEWKVKYASRQQGAIKRQKRQPCLPTAATVPESDQSRNCKQKLFNPKNFSSSLPDHTLKYTLHCLC